MKFYVVRHGQTDYNKLGVYQGQKDIPLNDVGIEQAIDMSRHLKEIVGENEISAIIVSPLTRAKQTAEPVSRIFGIEIEICDDIKERGFGNLEGQKPTPRLTNQMMLNYNKNCKDENIEPIQSFFNRVYTAMDKIVDRFSKIEKETGKEQNIVLVTHAAVTIVLNCYFNGKPEKLCYETLEPLVIKNAEIKVYEGGKKCK